MSTGHAILQGMRIVEVSAFVAAPLGGMSLAQLGADVVRIDPPEGGLDYRRWPVTDGGVSLFWAGLNKSKRSVAIDIGTAEGRQLAQALITAPGDGGGMFITNFPPRGWLAYENLRTLRPDLIQLTVQGDHNGGSAVDYTVNPRVGMPFLTGPATGDQAVNHVLPCWDLITGQLAATGLLAAERHRRLTGEGQHITLALEDVALAAMGHLGFIAEAQLGQERARHGNDLFGAFGRDFTTADGERVMVVGLTLKQWRALCAAVGIEEAIAALAARRGVDLDLEGERFRARDDIAQLVGPWVAQRTLAEVAALFERHRVCWGPYQRVSRLVRQDPACSDANPMFSNINQPGVGTLLAPATPLNFGTGRLAARPAPVLGADTDAVLAGWLNMSAGVIAALRARGIVGSSAAHAARGTRTLQA
jgi:2-methylfumaryl-CoA isomerase